MPFITPGISKTRESYPLSPKKVIKKTLSSLIIIFILLLVIYIFVAIFVATTAAGIFGSAMAGIIISFFVFLIIFLLILIPTYVYQKWYYTVYFYDLTEHFIVIKKGVFTPKEISVPYERVQDIYMDQDLLDRMFGLYDVHISSATISSGFEAHIDGVEKTAAEGLKNLLLTTVQTKIKRTNGNKAEAVQDGSPTTS
ncbi:MAG: Membrane-flanked domain DUF304 [Candidatus Curtissbacteria bacterium GW2011_GWA1_40_16]|uniref:Membrane-flanked domain DUF304 n=1 Tax=Candidatus Curtissbacteria bacterium GW2011_GWA1_40_16 TaxID=1618405 RepID=A0A0G0ULW6_9BACT|nr:MAG: Membrane-flanked domain DUF304 [Candidatus Curtissbacteria bacterium GW2011_GWA1_40_16]